MKLLSSLFSFLYVDAPLLFLKFTDFRSPCCSWRTTSAGLVSADQCKDVKRRYSAQNVWTHLSRSAETCKKGMNIVACWVWSPRILFRLNPEMHSHRLLASAPPQSCRGQSTLLARDFEIKPYTRSLKKKSYSNIFLWNYIIYCIIELLYLKRISLSWVVTAIKI